jgi:outer membrane protein assembly factor BamB
MIRILATILVAGLIQMAFAQSVHEWRGPGRTGVYSESGLLKEWPEEGPDLKWLVEEIPNGYSSATPYGENLYLTGIQDTMDVLVAVSNKGEILWQTAYGRAWTDSYNPSRCTPTVADNRIYISSGLGDVACVDAATGELVWQVKASEKYQGIYGKWGISESLLLIEDKVFFTPGGDLTTMVAFDKNTGEEIWKSESLEEEPSYTSPLYVNWKDQPMVVTATRNYIFGVDPNTGEILWTFDFGQFAGGEWKSNNQTNTPLFYEGKIFVTSGYDHRNVMIELPEKGNRAYFVWSDTTLDVHHGGAVRLGEYIYGASWEGNRDGNWVCLDWNTGKVMYETEWENKGSIISADGMLYCYEEKNGHIALVPATPEAFDPVSIYKIPYGKGPHWSHPVIHEGTLYIRHGQALMAYSLK